MRTARTPSRRGAAGGGLALAAGVGLVIAAIVQTLAPVVAKVPGMVLCGAGSFELVVRRRTSYAVCTDGGQGEVFGYALVFVVSILVWTLLLWPLGYGVARSVQRRMHRRRSRRR